MQVMSMQRFRQIDQRVSELEVLRAIKRQEAGENPFFGPAHQQFTENTAQRMLDRADAGVGLTPPVGGSSGPRPSRSVTALAGSGLSDSDAGVGGIPNGAGVVLLVGALVLLGVGAFLVFGRSKR